MLKKPARRGLRIAIWTVGILLLLVVAGIATVLATFDPNSLKPRIIEAVKQATGRDLTLKGRIGLAFALRPTIEVRDIALSNPPGYSGADMMTLGRVDLQLGLLPLLHRRVEIDRLVLNQPDIRLETDASGKPNWLFVPVAAPAPAQPSAAGATTKGQSAAFQIAVQDIRVVNGVVSYRDGKTGQTTSLALKQIATKAASVYDPLHLTGALVVNDTDITVTADTGPIARITEPAANGPWPVKLVVEAASARVSMEGTIADPQQGKGLDLALAAEVADPSALASLARQDLPSVQKIVFSAHLTDTPDKPANGVVLHDLKFTSSAGDFGGDLTYVPGTPESLTGTVTSKRLDIDALLKASQAPVSGAQASGGTAAGASPKPRSAATSHRIFSDQPLAFGQLQLFNADLQVNADLLHLGGADYKSINAHLVVRNGVLTLDPAGADLPEGHMGMTLSVDAGQPAPPVHLTFQAPSVALKSLLQALGEPSYATGNMQIIGDLSGSGETPHAIASSLDGYLGLAVAGGTIDLRQITGSAAEVLKVVNPQLSSSGASALRCLAVRLDANKGIGTFRALALSSGLVTMDGSGTVNLSNETLALNLRSEAKVGGANVAVPVSVTGAILAPHTQVNAVGIAQQNATALAGGVAGDIAGKGTPIGMLGNAIGVGNLPGGGQGDVCPGALALARNQAAGAAAASTTQAAATDPPPTRQASSPIKPPNVGKMLQQLFK